MSSTDRLRLAHLLHNQITGIASGDDEDMFWVLHSLGGMAGAW